MCSAARSHVSSSAGSSVSSACEAGEGLGLLGSEPAHRRGGVAEVEPGHQVREGVVVDHRRVLVGAGDAVDVEAAVVAVEAEVLPHPRRLDEDLGADLDEEVDVAAHVDVAADGVGDVGVEVVLGGAGLVVGRRLVAVDRAPREQRSAQVQLAARSRALGSMLWRNRSRFRAMRGWV